MAVGKCTVVRSVFRSVEILLFFVVSIMGATLFTRTTSPNTKSKTKSLSGAPLLYGDVAVAQPLPTGFDPQGRIEASSGKTIPDKSALSLFIALFSDHRTSLPRPDYNPTPENRYHSFQLPGASSLFQQNPVLLI